MHRINRTCLRDGQGPNLGIFFFWSFLKALPLICFSWVVDLSLQIQLVWGRACSGAIPLLPALFGFNPGLAMAVAGSGGGSITAADARLPGTHYGGTKASSTGWVWWYRGTGRLDRPASVFWLQSRKTRVGILLSFSHTKPKSRFNSLASATAGAALSKCNGPLVQGTILTAKASKPSGRQLCPCRGTTGCSTNSVLCYISGFFYFFPPIFPV